MSTLDVGDAVDLFVTLFELSIWVCGFIAIGYMMAVLSVFSRRMKAIRFKLGQRRR